MGPKRDAAASAPRKSKKTAPRSLLFERILENKPFDDVVRHPVHGVWMDAKTNMVFDPTTRLVVGVVASQEVRPLTVDDLRLARERGWKTAFVENLKQLPQE